MKPIRPLVHHLLLAAGLLPLGLSAQVAAPKAGAAAVTARTAAPAVQRLIIQYKPAALASAKVVAAGADERARASALVSQSAALAQTPGLHYLKSVSPQVHVARLDSALPADAAQALVERLRADPAVAAVVVDQRLRPHAVSDPYFTSPGSPYYQWHLQAPSLVTGGINAAAAWASSTGTGVTVAVLDGGYRPHADLAANLLTTSDHDFISADSDGSFWTANDGDARDANAEDPGDWVTAADALVHDCDASDSSWHGTHVAGLIGALANGVEGMGVAHGARVLPVRVLGRCGGYLSDIQAGMRWAAGLSVAGVVDASTPAKVMNLSLGIAGACDSITQSVVDEVRARGVSIVASTGNEGLTAITQPANCSGVLAMTAHNRSGASPDYANVGPGTALSAPGGDNTSAVASTWNLGTTVPAGDSYGLMYGTSMAAPQAVGVLALMASVRSDLALPTLEALMRDPAAVRPFPAGTYCATNPDNLPPGFCGSGLLDAGLALAKAQGTGWALADLEVLQRATASSWEFGSVVSLSIHLRNWGAQTATAVQLDASLTGLQILSVNAPGMSVTYDTSSLSAVAGDLAPNAERVLTVSARVSTSDAAVSSVAQTSSPTAEATELNNRHRLDPAGTVSDVSPPPETDSGGGCTMAPAGRADAGLPLLALVAALALLWRRRSLR